MTKNFFFRSILSWSEEALETRNKCNKFYRENHSWKDSRLHSIEDKFCRPLVTNDSKISFLSLKIRIEMMNRHMLKSPQENFAMTQRLI